LASIFTKKLNGSLCICKCVPTGICVNFCFLNLGIDDNNVVSLSYFIIACVVDKLESNVFLNLPASVKCYMKSAIDFKA